MGHNDTVIIDGLRAANVRWQSFTRVRNLTRPTWGRQALQFLLHALAPLLFVTGVSLVATSPQAGGPMLAFAILIILASPYALRKLYGGKFWDTQVCSDVVSPAQVLTIFSAMAIWI